MAKDTTKPTGFFRRLYWDLSSPTQRFQYGLWLIRNFPGESGVLLRSRYIAKYLKKTGEGFRARSGVKITGADNLVIGNNSNLGEDCDLQASGGIIIGNNVMMGPKVMIWSVNHKYNDKDTHIYEQGWNEKPVVISDGCWLGARVFVLPGAVLGEGCVVGACTVLEGKNYPAWSVIVGHPARVIGSRKD